MRASQISQLPNILRPLRLPLRLIPDEVHTLMIARLSNHLMRGQGLRDRLRALEGKTISIHIRDIPLALQFTIRSGRLERAKKADWKTGWDARISGDLADFWLLATRAEDPDTLFFSRRLNIEGDTETGLHMKNLLDGLDFDWQTHFEDVIGRMPPRPLVQLLSRVKAHFAGR